MILLLLTFLPFWQYYRIFCEYRIHPVNPDKIIAAYGIDSKSMTATNKALLASDWKKLYTDEPQNPAWFAQDFLRFYHTQTHSWNNGRPVAHIPITSDKLAEADKIDPGNALFDYTAAVEMLYLGTEYDDKRHAPSIKSRVKLMEALPYFLQGLQKPRYCNYWQEIAGQRMQLAKYVTGIRADIWQNYLYSAPIYGYDFSDYFTQALPMWADELIKSGHPDQAEQLLDCWSRLAGQYSQSSYFWQLHSLCFMIKDFRQTLPPLYSKLGKPEKAAAVEAITAKISNMWLRRYEQNNNSQTRKKVKEDFQRYAPSSQQYLASSLMPGEYNLNDYAIGRAWEYAISDRLVILITMLLMLSLLIGCSLAWLIIRLRLRQKLQPGLFVTNWKSLAYLALFGVIIPLGLWWLMTIIPSGSRDYALNYSSLNFIAQGLFLVLALTLWPLALLGYVVDKRASELILPGIKHPAAYHLCAITVILIAVAGIALVPWNGKYAISLTTIIPQSQYIYDYNYYFNKPQNMIFWIIITGIGVAFLLLPLIEAYRCRRDEQRRLKVGVTAAAFTIFASVIIIVLSGVAGICACHEQRLLEMDRINLDQYCGNSPRDKAGAQYRQYIREQLAALPPVTVPQVTYTLIDNKSFCDMVMSSPDVRIEKAIKQGADVNAADESGHTALMLACRYRDAKIIDLLLRHGAKVDSWCPPQPSHHNWLNTEMLTGVDALMTAAFYNSNPAVIHLLLRYGADPNRHAQRGYSRGDGLLFISDQMTPIMFAAWHNNPAVIQALLDAGVKVSEQKNFWFESILEMACLNNPDPQVAMQLKKNGAKLSRNSDKMNFTITACGGVDNEVQDKACRRLQAMISVGFDPSVKDDKGMTVMDYARKNRALNNPNTIKRLETIIKRHSNVEK
jgi:ankyrin repeat protein